ncbi:MAG: hypothetical protein IJZ53_01475 [Tyzzerella sp.]|nr:hypothetical protein [Tyzzerella sp.]
MKEQKFQRFANEYMGIGMCFGLAIGLAFGKVIFPDSMTLGMCFGLPIGMSLGLSIGQAKDRRLEQNAMEISRIEHLAGFTEVFIYAIDKNGVEKEFRVSDKVMKSEKFATGDKVAEEREGVLVSLESK